jgi:uncharacterized membrane protein
METLALLGAALGFATLSGINLYLTVFATGLAIHNHWITLSTPYQGLAVLGEPTVIAIAGVLFFIEFLADKIPGVDSAWDAVHTAIRPIGGAFLALRVLGTTDPTYEVIIALLAGGVALTAHGAKAGTRLLVNGSPEPFSNIAVSMVEDIGVLGGLLLMYAHPAIAFVVFCCIIATMLYVLPIILRIARTKLWLIWKKVSAAAGSEKVELRADLPSYAIIRLAELNTGGAGITWAAECLTGSSKSLPAHARGYLIALEHEPTRVYFVGRRGWKKISKRIEMEGYEVARERKFLSEDLVLVGPDKKPKCTFVFDRTRAGFVRLLAESLKTRLARPAPAAIAETPVTAANPEAAAVRP